jgi:hypothetical protein
LFDVFAGDRRRLRLGTRACSRVMDMGRVRVFIDHGFQWDGTQNVWLTRARACYVLEAGPVFDIKPRALIARVTGFFGGTPSGDPCFDNFFSVRTANAGATWGALTTRARSLLAGCFEDARLVSDGQLITLWREGDYGREADAEIAAETVAEIAGYRQEVIEELTHIPEADPYPASGPWDARKAPGVVLRLPTPVTVAPCAGARGAVLGIWSDCGRVVRPFAVSADESGRLYGDASRLPDHARFASDSSDGIGSCDIACDGRRIVLRFRELALPRERVLRGARLVAELSHRATGLYR